MAGSQISTGITIINSLLGYMGISITNQDTSAATAIATGSKVEVAGAFFTFGSDETPTGWTSITTATTGYIALTPSGTAGSQILSASWVTSGSVVWSDSKQGYYTSASSNIRVVASAYKTSATQYDYKKVLTGKAENIINSNAVGTDILRVLNKNYIHSYIATNPTSSTIYAALSSYIPNIGDIVPVWGSAADATGGSSSYTSILNIHAMQKYDATTIRLYVTQMQTPPNAAEDNGYYDFIQSGSSTNLGRSWTLVWYG